MSEPPMSDLEIAIAEAEQRGYTKGYNDCAKAQQRTLIEYGGRPKRNDVEMEMPSG
jgi:hypothetical protein